MHRTLIVFGICALVPACTSSEKLANSDYTNNPACIGLNNTFRCARAIEDSLLRIAGGRALRSGDTLSLRLSDGNYRRFVDDEISAGAGEETASLSYFGYLPIAGLYVLHAQYGEGNAFAVVGESSGRLFFVDGAPQPSPSGRWLLASENGDFNRIGVFIYEVNRAVDVKPAFCIAGHSSTSERCQLNDWSRWIPGEAKWLSDTAAVVDQLPPTAQESASTPIGKLQIRYRAGGWVAAGRDV